MNDIFTLINSIFFTKKKIDLNIEDTAFSSYMLNRWGSMYSPEVCYLINKTTNFRLDKIFGNSKDDIYNFFINIIPKLPYKKIQYIKKTKIKEDKKQKDNSDLIKNYAENYELSQREIKEYLEMLEVLND